MPKFRKKPVVIEAFQMTKARRQDNSEWPDWLNRAWNKEPVEVGAVFPATRPLSGTDQLIICTLEGNHLVDWGDFIIQGVKGELYPCKPDIFVATYDRVEFETRDKGVSFQPVKQESPDADRKPA